MGPAPRHSICCNNRSAKIDLGKCSTFSKNSCDWWEIFHFIHPQLELTGVWLVTGKQQNPWQHLQSPFKNSTTKEGVDGLSIFGSKSLWRYGFCFVIWCGKLDVERCQTRAFQCTLLCWSACRQQKLRISDFHALKTSLALVHDIS